MAAENGTLSILFENDVFFDTDRDYTNGVLFSYTFGPDKTPDFLQDAALALPHMLPDSMGVFPRGIDVRGSVELGQDIYTPTDISLVNPPLTERPYAGFLYLGFGVMTDPESPTTRDAQEQLQLQLGVVGPDSLAENTQKWIHALGGFQKPMGWDTQLKNEPALELTYERSWRFRPVPVAFGLNADLLPHIGGAVGNVYDYVNAGAMGRIGFNLPNDFGPARIDPSLPGSSYFASEHDWSVYAFAGIDGRAMGHNIFLDGNTFEHSRSVPKNVLVGDAQFGLMLQYAAYRLSFTHVFRTKEYRRQPGVDQFGAVNLSIRF